MHHTSFELARARGEELDRRTGRPERLHADALRRAGRTRRRRWRSR